MKHLLSTLLLLASLCAFANDGVYFTSGNLLTPKQETTISVTKEILTITIGKDNRAKVEVYYEFYNPDSTKRVAMAFEAAAPYNADPKNDVGKSISHPYIHDFKVVMNDQPLAYRNALILSKWNKGEHTFGDEIDLREWKHETPYKDERLWPNQLYNARMDSFIEADYGYMFEATFKHGKNIVRHTYSYDMSYSIGDKYDITYRLSPATRWANHQIDDFTLRIKNENNRDYCIADSAFLQTPFHIAEGSGDIYPFVNENSHNTLVAAFDDAVLEWHAKNFVPDKDLYIVSVDRFIPTMLPYMYTTESQVVVASDGTQYRYIGDSGDNYLVIEQDYGMIPKGGSRLETFSAKNGKGIVTIRDNKTVKIRQEPTTKSGVVATIKNERGELPVVLNCLGYVPDLEINEFGFADYQWFKVETDGKTGYIRADLMMWDSINTY